MSSSGRSKIVPSHRLDAEGRTVGHLTVPHSRNESGWGSLRVPFAVFGNGSGPSVLLTGGNHGDELEGPIALLKLIRELDISQVRGRIIVMPALNYPALKAAQRVSPIDGGNMNRAFPGARDGTITQQIAHFVQTEILLGVDAVLDIHAGGKTMYFQPFAAVHELDNPTEMERALAALKAFGAPLGLVLKELDAEGMLDSAVENLGKLFVSTELGGGGTTSPGTIAIAERGIRNFLHHVGALSGTPRRQTAPTRMIRTDDRSYLAADGPGLVEYLIELGATVRQGDIVCQIHDVDHPLSAPVPYRAGTDGILIGRLHGGRTEIGDFLGLIGFDA